MTAGTTTALRSHHLPYRPRTPQERTRDIIWYNPPFSRNVATSVGQSFLKILDRGIPEEPPVAPDF